MATALKKRRASDGQILDILHRRYSPKLKASLLKRLGDPHRAEELAQEVFTRAAERGELGNVRSLRAYIFRIVRNLRIELARIDQCERDVLTVSSTLAEHASDHPTQCSQGMTDVECEVDLLGMVTRLSGRRALVFRLSLEGYSYREIALQLGISESAVGQDLMHARQELAEMLNQSGGAGDGISH